MAENEWTAYFWNESIVMNGRVIKKETFLISFKIFKAKARFFEKKIMPAAKPTPLLHYCLLDDRVTH